jgi:carboxylesterase type B
MPRSPDDSYNRRHIRGLLVQMQQFHGSQCMQSGEGGPVDCLFLNIWTTVFPAHAGSNQLKSARFWIRSGAFTGSTTNNPTFNEGNIASRGEVVMCAINYRLSTLGFLALNDGVTKGNYRFADQIKAWDWVRNNIRISVVIQIGLPHSGNQQELHLSEQC